MNQVSTQLLADKVIIVTGGSSGCGWGFTKECVLAGAKVMVADINPISEKKLNSLKELASHVSHIYTDVSQADSITACVDRVTKEAGRIDGVINNAGLTIFGEFLDFDLQDIDRLYKTNLRSVVLMSQAVGRVMVKQGGGAIVNISSNHATASTAEYEMYAATKGGVCALTRAMSWSLGKHGIRVNTLSPGLTRTEPIDDMTQKDPALENAFNSLHATNRFNSVEELGRVGVFLLSDMAAPITGSDIVADQGLLASLVNSDVLN